MNRRSGRVRLNIYSAGAYAFDFVEWQAIEDVAFVALRRSINH
jgi:hypothetical protein